VACLLVRAHFGGMKCDVDMLRVAAGTWRRRFLAHLPPHHSHGLAARAPVGASEAAGKEEMEGEVAGKEATSSAAVATAASQPAASQPAAAPSGAAGPPATPIGWWLAEIEELYTAAAHTAGFAAGAGAGVIGDAGHRAAPSLASAAPLDVGREVQLDTG
jgi:hypothetical protein